MIYKVLTEALEKMERSVYSLNNSTKWFADF